jgi:hypothetical protein
MSAFNLCAWSNNKLASNQELDIAGDDDGFDVGEHLCRNRFFHLRVEPLRGAFLVDAQRVGFRQISLLHRRWRKLDAGKLESRVIFEFVNGDEFGMRFRPWRHQQLEPTLVARFFDDDCGFELAHSIMVVLQVGGLGFECRLDGGENDRQWRCNRKVDAPFGNGLVEIAKPLDANVVVVACLETLKREANFAADVNQRFARFIDVGGCAMVEPHLAIQGVDQLLENALNRIGLVVEEIGDGRLLFALVDELAADLAHAVLRLVFGLHVVVAHVFGAKAALAVCGWLCVEYGRGASIGAVFRRWEWAHGRYPNAIC